MNAKSIVIVWAVSVGVLLGVALSADVGEKQIVGPTDGNSVEMNVEEGAVVTEVSDTAAEEILLEMARTLAEAEQFTVMVRSNYDAVQKNGQMVEYGVLRRIQIKRPNKLRVDSQRSDGEQRVLLFDGKQIVLEDVTKNIYATVEHTGSLDETIKHLVSELKVPVPLARMFRTSFPDELGKLIEKVEYVEKDVLTPVPSDHLAVTGKDVDLQVWVAQGTRRLPQRIVIDYKNAPDRPQFRADFSEWDVSSGVAAGPYDFTPSSDMRKVELLVPSMGSGAEQKGGSQ